MSKASNYRIILRHGQPAEPLTGRTAVPGLYVKFEDGVAIIPESGLGGVSREEIYEMMRAHESFGKDFRFIEDEEVDPYAKTRKPKEPEHTIYNLERGAFAGAINPKKRSALDPKQREALMDIAKKMALEMAPKLAEGLLKKMLEEKQNEAASKVEKVEETDDKEEGKTLSSTEEVSIPPSEPTPAEVTPAKRGRPRKTE